MLEDGCITLSDVKYPCSGVYGLKQKSVLFVTDADEQPEKKRRRRIKNDLFDSSSSEEGKNGQYHSLMF